MYEICILINIFEVHNLLCVIICVYFDYSIVLVCLKPGHVGFYNTYADVIRRLHS